MQQVIAYVRNHRDTFITIVVATIVSLIIAPVANLVFRPLWAPEWPVNISIYIIWLGALLMIAAEILSLVVEMRDFTLMRLSGIFILILGIMISLGILFATGGWMHKIIAVAVGAILGVFWRLSFMQATVYQVKEALIFLSTLRRGNSQ